MSVYQFIKEQRLSVGVNDLWEFIATPRNLQKITPDYMGFKIVSTMPIEQMYEGMIITYKVKPLLSIPTTWVTEITHIKPMEYFVDEQRVGPYALWHHEHFVESIKGGTLMRDIVTYKPPVGILGSLANKLFIKQKLNEIFSYREKVLKDYFGSHS